MVIGGCTIAASAVNGVTYFCRIAAVNGGVGRRRFALCFRPSSAAVVMSQKINVIMAL